MAPAAASAPVKMDPPRSRGSVLIIDDEPAIRRAYGRILERVGFQVHAAAGGAEATQLLDLNPVDAIVSDIHMAGGDGLSFLTALREHDTDMPVVLMTGSPMVESAMEAVAGGALRYLTKPVDRDELVAVVEKAVQLHKMARAKREALALLGGYGPHLADRAGLDAAFSRAVDSLWMAFQPIVSWSARRVVAYEALVRNEEPTLVRPDHFFDAAERLGRLHQLGRKIRASFSEAADLAPADAQLYLNLHPMDLQDDDLFSGAAPLSALASRVVLEVTERDSLSKVKDVRARMAALRAMGFRVAIDDLGAGYAGLTSFAQLEPEVVKLDMSLIRNCDAEPTKRKLIGTFIDLCADMKVQVICEGVETPGERDALVGLGCDLMQGYLFAKPGKPMPTATF